MYTRVCENVLFYLLLTMQHDPTVKCSWCMLRDWASRGRGREKLWLAVAVWETQCVEHTFEFDTNAGTLANITLDFNSNRSCHHLHTCTQRQLDNRFVFEAWLDKPLWRKVTQQRRIGVTVRFCMRLKPSAVEVQYFSSSQRLFSEMFRLSQGHKRRGDDKFPPEVTIRSHKSTASSWTPPSLFLVTRTPNALCQTQSPPTPQGSLKAALFPRGQPGFHSKL